MKMQRLALLLLLAFASLSAPANEPATQLLDQNALPWKPVHGDGQMAPLALTESGKPLAVLIRLPKGGVLQPHSGSARWHFITVVSGTLSYADGDVLDQGKLQDYPAGSVLVLPQGLMHYAMAQQNDVLLQVTLIHKDSLTPDVRRQMPQNITGAPATHHQAAPVPSQSALVAFLTTDDPMIAGHAVHFARHMLDGGRRATLLLIGEAGRLGIKTLPSPISALSNAPLRQDLSSFIAAGGTVYISPYTLRHFAASPEMLADGVTVPKDPPAVHRHMFDPATQLVVW
jgi:quercetin dioxygenase-like cupin family protein